MKKKKGVSINTGKIISTFDIAPPKVRKDIFNKKTKQGLTIFFFLESLGYSRPTKLTIFKRKIILIFNHIMKAMIILIIFINALFIIAGVGIYSINKKKDEKKD